MKLPRFTLRDLLWLVLVCALAVAWWVDHRWLSNGLKALTQHIYRAEGRYAHWNNNGEMIVTDK